MSSGKASYLKEFADRNQFKTLHKLFEGVFCTPATSAPVERVFSHGGIFMKPHRARMGDKVLSDLVFVKCNKLKKHTYVICLTSLRPRQLAL